MWVLLSAVDHLKDALCFHFVADTCLICSYLLFISTVFTVDYFVASWRPACVTLLVCCKFFIIVWTFVSINTPPLPLPPPLPPPPPSILTIFRVLWRWTFVFLAFLIFVSSTISPIVWSLLILTLRPLGLVSCWLIRPTHNLLPLYNTQYPDNYTYAVQYPESQTTIHTLYSTQSPRQLYIRCTVFKSLLSIQITVQWLDTWSAIPILYNIQTI